MYSNSSPDLHEPPWLVAACSSACVLPPPRAATGCILDMLILVPDQRSVHNNGEIASARSHTYLW